MEKRIVSNSEKRRLMVADQIENRGISDSRLLAAMLKVERHQFVGKSLKEAAYEDYPLAIGSGQTISQPYIVAIMTDALALRKTDRVLEIGTGSGYQTAILAELCHTVYTVERHESLSVNAKKILNTMKYSNIYFKTGDGTLGWEEFAPYDRILVTAAAPAIPESLFDQLASSGKMIVPVGGRSLQHLKLVTKNSDGKMKETDHGGCLFVPLIGEQGWRSDG